jgi:hypothetical protein
MSNLFIKDKDITTSKSPFAKYEGEEKEFDGRDSGIRIDHIMLKVKKEYVFGVDFDIIEAIYKLQYSTSRMITQYLNLKGINIEQGKVQNRLNFLNRLTIISRYKVVNKESSTNTRIYCLEYMGKRLLQSREIECNWKQTDSGLELSMMKKILARNQVLLTYRSRLNNITNYKTEFKNYSFAPDLEISLGEDGKTKEVMWFNVFRSYEGWEEKAEEKIREFKNFIDYFKKNVYVPIKPTFVIVGEDDKHLFEIFKIALINKLQPKDQSIKYTSDLRVIGNDLNKSLIEFTLEKQGGKYKPNLKELNFVLLKEQ